MGVSEERVLAERAVRAIRSSNHRLLIIGLILSIGGILIMAWPDLRVAVGGGEPIGLTDWIVFGFVGADIAAIGVALSKAAFGRFDAEGHPQTWFVVVTAVPLLGPLVRWIVLRSEREAFDPGQG